MPSVRSSIEKLSETAFADRNYVNVTKPALKIGFYWTVYLSMEAFDMLVRYGGNEILEQSRLESVLEWVFERISKTTNNRRKLRVPFNYWHYHPTNKWHEHLRRTCLTVEAVQRVPFTAFREWSLLIDLTDKEKEVIKKRQDRILANADEIAEDWAKEYTNE